MKNLFIFWDEPLNLTGGGIHRTINFLLTHLPARGINVRYIYSLDKYHTFHLTQENGHEVEMNISQLKQYLIEEECNYILGQEAVFSDTFTRAFVNMELENVKLINQYHNSLLYFDKKLTFHYLHLEWKMNKKIGYRLNLLTKAITYPLWKYMVRKTQRNVYKYNYKHSDMSLLLSGNEEPIMGNISGDEKLLKCVSIPNPLSWDTISSPNILKIKKKEVLIVSRIYNFEKRIDLALKSWSILQKKGMTKDWTLRIVGDGIHKDYLKNMAVKLKLENVIWVGRCNPLPFYETASIFLLTSAVEGWALTLTESMQMGTVPIAFDSYPAVRDIITDGYNGYLIPNGNILTYAEKLGKLMQQPTLRHEMALNGLESCQRFASDVIVGHWEKMLNIL